MKTIRIPRFIRESVHLDKAELDQLAQAAQLPTEEEIDEIRGRDDIRELLNAFIGDENTRNTHLQLKAKTYLAEGDIAMAWKVMLL